jgi:hypothetical protein
LRLFSPQTRILFCRKLLQTVQKAFGEPGPILRVQLQSGVFEFVDAHNQILPPHWTAGQGGPTDLAFSCVARARRSIALAMRPRSGPRQLQRVVRLRLEIGGREAGVFGNASEHARPDLVAIMECKDEVRPAGTLQDAMGTG